ncbi:MAG: D-alanyl-D-alanine carboxypeptidase [Defluviitaleaceae bacterium]|nr:D-alanyl-D-alanine carboxypeptidase [Defluviitaleaceae bacterium]
MKLIIFLLIFLFIIFDNTYAVERELTGTGIILMERSTGRVIYEQNSNMLIYPASMIKVLTTIVALEHMDMNEIVVVGEEINHVPFGSSTAGHFIGEHITGRNLIYGLLLPSGNDTSNVVAAHVAYLVTGNSDMHFEEAEAIFINLMNEKARSIGAESSYFTNAHGFHDPRMRVTASDLALIANYAMNNAIIREVASTISIETQSAYGVTGATRDLNWFNTNRLLTGEFYYPYAIGLKTGFHTPAGHSFIGVASKDGLEFITVIGGSTANQRWIDTTYLFEYAFANYSIETIHIGNNAVSEFPIKNRRWGDNSYINTYGTTNFSSLFSLEELARIERELVLFEDPFYIDSDGHRFLVAPLYAGNMLGEIIYRLDGEVIFTDNIVTRTDIYAWSYISSIQYMINYVIENPISIISLSAYLGIIFFLMILIRVISFIVKLVKRRKKRKKYNSRFDL